MVAIFLICLAATGSPWSATLVCLTLCMLLVDIMGFMALTGIQLNAGAGLPGWGQARGRLLGAGMDCRQGRGCAFFIDAESPFV